MKEETSKNSNSCSSVHHNDKISKSQNVSETFSQDAQKKSALLPLRIPGARARLQPREGLRDWKCSINMLLINTCREQIWYDYPIYISLLRYFGTIQPASTRTKSANRLGFFSPINELCKLVRQTNSPAQLFADQLIIGCERVSSYPRVDFGHHSVFVHCCWIWHWRWAWRGKKETSSFITNTKKTISNPIK